MAASGSYPSSLLRAKETRESRRKREGVPKKIGENGKGKIEKQKKRSKCGEKKDYVTALPPHLPPVPAFRDVVIPFRLAKRTKTNGIGGIASHR